MIEFKKVGKEDWKEVKAIYKEAFPKREQKPFFSLRFSVYREKVLMYVAKEDGVVLGFIVVCVSGDLVMVDYLAVSQKIRSKGTGSYILSSLSKLYKDKRIVLLIEKLDECSDNVAQRIARRKFYFKNGFESSNLYMQGKSGEMEILSLGGKVSRPEFLRVFKADLGPLFFKLAKVTVY